MEGLFRGLRYLDFGKDSGMFKNGRNRLAIFLMAVAMLGLAWRCSAGFRNGLDGLDHNVLQPRLERLVANIPTEVKDLFSGYNF